MNKLALCRSLTKNANAAQLLYRIAYWMPKATIERRGLKWVINPTTWWCNETGLSSSQYRRAIALLRRLGFVETEQHLFGRKCVTHIRITGAATTSLEVAPPELSKSAPAGIGETAQPGTGKSAQLYIQGASYTEIHHKKQTKGTLANAPVNSGTPLKTKNTGEKKKEEKSTEQHSELKNKNKHSHPPSAISSPPLVGSTSAQNDLVATTPPPSPKNECGSVLTGPGASQEACLAPSNVDAGEVITPKELAAVWAEIVQNEYKDFVPPPKKKELAQLKQFIALCPPGQSAAILEICLSNWGDFIAKAKSDYGAFGLPLRPTTDFLLKYSTAAINFGRFTIKKNAEKEKSTAIASAQQSPAVTKAIESPLTEEQIIAKTNDEPEMAVLDDYEKFLALKKSGALEKMSPEEKNAAWEAAVLVMNAD